MRWRSAGKDINARKENTRMTVEVRVNGRGPYQFLVDSGADSSVVGLRSPATCNCRWGTPTVLHGIHRQRGRRPGVGSTSCNWSVRRSATWKFRR